MSKLTYKVKHNADLSSELKKAKDVALFALKTCSLSSKDVKQIRVEVHHRQSSPPQIFLQQKV